MGRSSFSLILLFVAVCIRGSCALGSRKLLSGAVSLVDELETLRQRLLSTTGFSQPQWARKLQQDYNPYSTGSYYGGYGYGYYYGGYYSGGGMGHDYMMARRRSLLSTAGSAGHMRQLKMAYPDPYGSYYGGYYGYGYYYGSYPAANDPYAMMAMAGRRRNMLSSVEHLAEMLTDESDGWVDPATIDIDPRRDLKAMPYWAPSADYGYSYGYGYYYGGYGGYAMPYSW